MRRHGCHWAWLALVLCTGCAAPYPPVPTHELAGRILDPAPQHVELPSRGSSPEELPQPKPVSNTQPDHRPSKVMNAIANEPDLAETLATDVQAARSAGRRLNISQASAFAEPLDRPAPALRVEETIPNERESHTISADQLTLASAI